MKTYKETDNLSELRAGDRLEMNDGSLHLSVNGSLSMDGTSDCKLHCSMYLKGHCNDVNCVEDDFHFKQLTK